MKSARKKTKAIPKFIGRFNPAEAQALGRIFLKITGNDHFYSVTWLLYNIQQLYNKQMDGILKVVDFYLLFISYFVLF